MKKYTVLANYDKYNNDEIRDISQGVTYYANNRTIICDFETLEQAQKFFERYKISTIDYGENYFYITEYFLIDTDNEYDFLLCSAFSNGFRQWKEEEIAKFQAGF